MMKEEPDKDPKRRHGGADVGIISADHTGKNQPVAAAEEPASLVATDSANRKQPPPAGKVLPVRVPLGKATKTTKKQKDRKNAAGNANASVASTPGATSVIASPATSTTPTTSKGLRRSRDIPTELNGGVREVMDTNTSRNTNTDAGIDIEAADEQHTQLLHQPTEAAVHMLEARLVPDDTADVEEENERLRQQLAELGQQEREREEKTVVGSAEVIPDKLEDETEPSAAGRKRTIHICICIAIIVIAAVVITLGVSLGGGDGEDTSAASSVPTPVVTAGPSVPPPAPTNPPRWVPLGGDLNGLEESQAGASVAMAANVLAVGNYLAQVDVYQLVEDIAWSKMAQGIGAGEELLPLGNTQNVLEDNNVDDECCRSVVALSRDGTTMAIGSPRHNQTGEDAGMVQVYRLDNDDLLEWRPWAGPLYGLQNGTDGWPGGELFGSSVSLSDTGTILAVGAPMREGNEGATLGQVRLYQYSSNNDGDGDYWEPLGLPLDDGEDYQYGQFGTSVSLSGDGRTVAVGAPDYDSPYDHVGVVQIFAWTEDTQEWIRKGSPLFGEGRLDRSGTSVSLSRDGLTVAIGAPGNNINQDTFAGPGHVRVYRFFGNDWSQLGQDIDGPLNLDADQSGHELGTSVALSDNGNVVVVGAPGHGTGYAQVLQLREGRWQQLGDDLLGEYEGDRFGSSVALYTAVAGTSDDFFTCPEAGDAAYGNKPTLDSLNDAACAMADTFEFTALVEDETASPACTTYCASCEAGVCGYGGDGKVTCSDPLKCTLCADPPGCDVDTSLFGDDAYMYETITVAVGAPRNSEGRGNPGGHVRVYRLEGGR